MRNLNKVLALVLALAMAMSFTFVATAASYPDVTSGTPVAKAVDLLSGLGVIGGYPDGTFGPDKTITRAEFLKVLFILTNGTGEESLYAGGSTKYSDVTADKWYASYVNWATQLNIVGGYPDGTFKPDDAVKVSEASKMFVVALGYNAADFTFPYGFIDRAKKSGLFEDVAGAGAEAAAPRSIIALMASNFLFVPDAPGYSFWNKDLEKGPDWDYKAPIAQNFNAEENISLVMGTSNVNPGSISKVNQVAFESLYGNVGGNWDSAFNCDALIGHVVTVWTNENKTTNKDQIIAVIDEADQAFTVTSDKIVMATGNTGDLKRYDLYAVVNGKNVALAYADRDSNDKTIAGSYSEAWYTRDGSETFGSNVSFGAGADDSAFDGSNFALLNADGTALANMSATFTFIDNYIATDIPENTTDWDAVFVNYSLTGEVTAVTSDSIAIDTVNGGAQIDADQIKGSLSTFKEGDYANVTVMSSLVDNSAQDVYTITKAETLTGAKVGEVDDSTGEVEFNGKSYKLSAYCKDDLGDLVSGDLTDVVLDKSGYVYTFTATTALENYMLITNVTESTSTIMPNAKVTGLLADGTTKTFTIDDAVASFDYGMNAIYSDGVWLRADGSTPASSTDIAAIGKLVIYETNSDGEIDTMMDPAAYFADTTDSDDDFSIMPTDGVFKLDPSQGVIYNAAAVNGTYSLDKFVTDSTKVFVVDTKNATGYSDWKFNVYAATKMSAFENTEFAYYSVDKDETDNASVILINQEMGKSYGTNNILAMRTGKSSVKVASDGKTAQLGLQLFINGEIKTVYSVPVSISANSSTSAIKQTLVEEIFGDATSSIPANASEYFGYADINSAGQLVAYYEGSARDLTLANLATENDTATYGDVSVNRAAVAKINGSILTVAEVDSNNNAIMNGNAFNNTKMVTVASDCKITVIDALPTYADNDTAITATSGTLAGLSRSVESASGDTYIIDFAVREKSGSNDVYEVYQIFAYKQAVERTAV